jgi:Trypsin-co-occurring domain 1
MTDGVPRCDKLRLRIAPGPRVARQVTAFGPDGRAASGAIMLPFEETQLENRVLRVGRPCGMPAYRALQMGEKAKPFGSKLFDASVAGQVRDVYLHARCVLDQNERGLRVRLYLTDVAELMEVPWELLYDRPSFLSRRYPRQSYARSISKTCARLAGEQGASSLVEVDEPEQGSAVTRGGRPAEAVFKAGQTLEKVPGQLGPSVRGMVSELRSAANSTDEAEVEVEFAIKLSTEANTLIRRTGTEANFRIVLRRSRAGTD